MLDFLMNLFGYENVNKIKIPEGYKVPRADKIRCKLNFHNATGKFQDTIIINKQKNLLDGYITLIICKWADIKYVKVLKIDAEPKDYELTYRGYRLKKREKRQER